MNLAEQRQKNREFVKMWNIACYMAEKIGCKEINLSYEIHDKQPALLAHLKDNDLYDIFKVRYNNYCSGIRSKVFEPILNDKNCGIWESYDYPPQDLT